jgi:hypothetical protein
MARVKWSELRFERIGEDLFKVYGVAHQKGRCSQLGLPVKCRKADLLQTINRLMGREPQ